MDDILMRFIQRAPVAVMVRATLERIFSDSALDAVFEEHAETQYTRELRFSTLTRLLAQVTFGSHRNVHTAYQHAEKLPVSLTCLYGKLKGVEPRVAQALVETTAQACGQVMAELPGPRPQAIKGLRERILDGNFLAGTEHRLKELRASGAAALPGMALVVRDGLTGVLTNVLPCEDAYTSERALAEQVMNWVQADDLWIADRNFCTLDYMDGIEARQGFFLIRHHAGTQLEPITEERFVGSNATGDVYEHQVRASGRRRCRCIVIRLHEPMRDGTREVRLLTNVPASKAGALRLAERYRTRWTIESAFQDLTVSLRCEINTLGYPKAALFAFCLAMIAYNAIVVIRAALATGQSNRLTEEELSNYHLAYEVATVSEGMSIAVPAQTWRCFAEMTNQAFASWLHKTVQKLDWKRYKKTKRGPKKPVTIKRTRRGAHRSTARLLNNPTQTP